MVVESSQKGFECSCCRFDRKMMALPYYLQKGKSQSGEDHRKVKQTSETMKRSNRKEKILKSQESVGTAVNETVQFVCFSPVFIFID